MRIIKFMIYSRGRVQDSIPLVSAPEPLTAAADGLHHRYAERGSGKIFRNQRACHSVMTLCMKHCGSCNLHSCCTVIREFGNEITE